MSKDNKKYECLKLDHQLCFPLYAAAREIVNRYKPVLEELDLTYTQYITMLVMWENESISVRDMGKLSQKPRHLLMVVNMQMNQKFHSPRLAKRSGIRTTSLSPAIAGLFQA